MKELKVLLVNGSPHKDGCVRTALAEIADTLDKEGIKSDVFWIGNARKYLDSTGCRLSGRVQEPVAFLPGFQEEVWVCAKQLP